MTVTTPEALVTAALEDLLKAIGEKMNASGTPATALEALSDLERYALDAAVCSACTFMQIRIIRMLNKETQ